MLVTLDGIVTDVNPLQPENIPSPMLVTLDGILTDTNPLQLLRLFVHDCGWISAA